MYSSWIYLSIFYVITAIYSIKFIVLGFDNTLYFYTDFYIVVEAILYVISLHEVVLFYILFSLIKNISVSDLIDKSNLETIWLFNLKARGKIFRRIYWLKIFNLCIHLWKWENKGSKHITLGRNSKKDFLGFPFSIKVSRDWQKKPWSFN